MALQISPRCLINFDTLKESLEVSGTEALVVASLDDFNEDGWTILNRFGEYLQEVAVIIVVNQDLQLLQHLIQSAAVVVGHPIGSCRSTSTSGPTARAGRT